MAQQQVDAKAENPPEGVAGRPATSDRPVRTGRSGW